jgi:hypothetical protein
MQIIKYKNGNIMINGGSAGVVQGSSKLLSLFADMLEKSGTNIQPVQTNKTGDTIITFDHEIDKR